MKVLTFGEWVAQERELRKLTKTECAKRAGITPQRWAQIEYDLSNRSDGSPPQISRKSVEKVALGLGVPVSEALRAAGFMPDVVAEPRLVYEREDVQELLSGYLGTPDEIKPASLAAVLALRDSAIKGRDKYTVGKRIPEEVTEPEI